jgi:hypothetical protein
MWQEALYDALSVFCYRLMETIHVLIRSLREPTKASVPNPYTYPLLVYHGCPTDRGPRLKLVAVTEIEW